MIKLVNQKSCWAKSELGQLVLMGCLIFLGIMLLITATPSVGISQDDGNISHQTPSPFDPAETQHGFSEFDTIPLDPSEPSSNPLPYYKDLVPEGQPLPFMDKKPEGLFLDITLSEDIDEELDIRHRGNIYYPVRPTEEFPIDTPAIYVVFRVFKHYQAYQIIGQVFPDTDEGKAENGMIDEDMAYLKLEDESGYLKFFPPTEHGWKTGPYRIDIYVGYEANPVSRMGTLRFRVIQNS